MCRVHIGSIAGIFFMTCCTLCDGICSYSHEQTHTHTNWYLHFLVCVLCFFINKIAEWRFNLRVVSDATAWKYTHPHTHIARTDNTSPILSHSRTINTLCSVFQIVPLPLILLCHRVFDSRCLVLLAVKLNRAYLSSDKSLVKASFLMHNELPGICFTFCERERDRMRERDANALPYKVSVVNTALFPLI